MKVLFLKYNRERISEYQTETMIFEDAGKRHVRKRAVTSEAMAHVQKMIENGRLSGISIKMFG